LTYRGFKRKTASIKKLIELTLFLSIAIFIKAWEVWDSFRDFNDISYLSGIGSQNQNLGK